MRLAKVQGEDYVSPVINKESTDKFNDAKWTRQALGVTSVAKVGQKSDIKSNTPKEKFVNPF